MRTQRHKKIGDNTSPMVYTLRRKPKDAKILDLERIAQDIEALGSMSAEDVVHVGRALVRQIRQTLTDGKNVRLDGFGIFYTTFKCLRHRGRQRLYGEKHRTGEYPLQSSEHAPFGKRHQRHDQRQSQHLDF